MSSTWNLIERSLNEASGKDSLLSYIRMAHGDNEADNLAPFLDSMWNSKDLPTLAKHLVGRYSDSRVNAIFDKAFASFGIVGKDVKSAVASKPAVLNRTKGKSLATSKAPKSKKKGDDTASFATQYRTPDQAAAQKAATAATAASRPDRIGDRPAPPPGRPQVSVKPGEKAVHDVGQSVRGTSPGHTKQPIDQPSVVMQPSRLAAQLKPLEDRARQLQQDITVNLKDDPTKKMQLAKANSDLAALKGKINTLKRVGSSGVEDAQADVDKLSKTDKHGADALALRLGVPTTKQRTRKTVDPKTGEEKLEVQTWDQEKVYRFMNRGGTSQGGRFRIKPELDPGTYDPTPGQGGSPMPVTNLGKKGHRPDARHGVSVPTPSQQKGAATQKITKPMMKAPHGLSNEELAQLSSLKAKYSKLKQTGGDEGQMAQLKSQIDQIMSTGEVGDVVRPGLKKGMKWGDVVWDGTDWVLASQMVAQAGADVSEPKA